MSVRLGADAESTSVSDLQNLGCTFVCRYLSPVGNSKNLSWSEANELQNAGIDVVSNWELNTDDWTGGYNQGVNYAQQAASLHTACGGPAAAPIYFSVDEDVDAQSVVNSGYFQGINSVIGVQRTGCYGSTSVIAALTSAGLIGNLGQPLGWRTMSTDFAGGVGDSSQFSIEQTGPFNEDYDRDASVADNFGQWSANNGSAPAPTPTPVPVPVPAPVTEEDDDMSAQSVNGKALIGWAAGTKHVLQVGYDGVSPTLRVVLQLPTGPLVLATAWKPTNGSAVLEFPSDVIPNVRGAVVTDTASTGNVFVLSAS